MPDVAVKRSNTLPSGAFCLLLFGLIFASSGSYGLYATAQKLIEWQTTSGWIETQAHIKSVAFQKKRSGDSHEYAIDCYFIYTFEGTEYQGSRLHIGAKWSSFESWPRRQYERLVAARDNGHEVTCWVDGNDPSTAVLSRDLRTDQLAFSVGVTVASGVIGLTLIAAWNHIRRSSRFEMRQKAEHPKAPWLWKRPWAEVRIRSKSGMKRMILWSAASFALAISTPVLVALPGKLARGDYAILIALVFPLISVCLTFAAIRATLQHRRFGQSYLKLESVPGIIGGHLRGKLAIVGETITFDKITITLRCIRTRTTGRGKHSQTHRDLLWEDLTTFDALDTRFGQAQLELPFDFQIPWSCEQTRAKDDARVSVDWNLAAEANIPGVDLALEFDVPVFKTAESDPETGDSPERLARIERALNQETPPLPQKIRVQRSSGSTTFIVSAWPGSGLAGGLLAMALCTLGVAIFAGFTFTKGEMMLLLFSAVFGLAGLTMLLVFLTFFGVYRTTIRDETIRIERRYLTHTRTRQLPAASIRSVKQSKTGTSHSRWGDACMYAVSVTDRDGKPFKIGGSIRGEVPARWLVRKVERALGLRN